MVCQLAMKLRQETACSIKVAKQALLINKGDYSSAKEWIVGGKWIEETFQKDFIPKEKEIDAKKFAMKLHKINMLDPDSHVARVLDEQKGQLSRYA